MLPLKKIFCPTDFSEPSYIALQTAVECAGFFTGELILVHVVTPIPVIPVPDAPTSFNVPSYEKEMEASAHSTLERIVAEKIPPALTSRVIVVQGDPAFEIVRLANEEKADIIIIATHGLTGWKKLIFGSVTEKVIRVAHCPVLSIRATTPAKPSTGGGA